MIEVFGEVHACRMFRKVAPWYSKRFGPAKEFNHHVVQVSSRTEFLALLDRYRQWRQQFLDESGETQAPLPPAAHDCILPQEAGAEAHGHIPVPKGPVEVW